MRVLTLFLFSCFLVIASATQVALAVPSIDLLKKNLGELGQRKLPEVEQQDAQHNLEQAIIWLEQAEQSRNSLSQLEQQLATAPQLIRTNRQQLAVEVQKAERRQLPTQISQAKLEQLLAEQERILAALQQELSQANAAMVRAQTRPERAQIDISASQKRSLEINNQLKNNKDSSKQTLSAERVTALQAELEALQQRNLLRQAELVGNSVLQDLANSQRELQSAKVQFQEDYIASIQSLLSAMRQAESRQAVEQQSLQVEKAGQDTLLLRESSLNLKLSDYLLEVTQRRNQLSQQSLHIRQQLDSVQQLEQALDEQLAVLQGSVLLAKILYQQKQALPHLELDTKLADQIADIRLNQFELRQLRENLQRPVDYAKKIATDSGQADNSDLEAAVLDLLQTRIGLLERLNHEINGFLSEAIALQLNQKQLQSRALRLRNLLDEQMFWVPSNKPLDGQWLTSVPSKLKTQLKGLQIGQLLQQLFALWLEHAILFLPALLLTLLVLWKRAAMYERMRKTQVHVGHYLQDRQYITPLALLTVLLLSLPPVSWLATAGWLAQGQSSGVLSELGTALLNMAKMGLVFSVSYRLLGSQGVVRHHLGRSASQVKFLRARVAWVALCVWLLALVVPLAQANLAALSDDVLGVLLLCFALLSLSLLLGSAALQDYGVTQGVSWPSRLINYLLALIPLVLVGTIAAGYYYTALQLTERLLITMALLVLWVILRASLERVLAIAARRLAWQRVQASQSNNAELGQESPEHSLGVTQASAQSLKLVRLLLAVGLVLLLLWVWADVISLFAYLDKVVLYENYSEGTGGLEAVSLRDLLNAGVIIGMTFMLARNLPGLLEVLLLSRINLAQGSSYATLRLLSYSVFSVGIVATLAVLGVSWSKLQWLVAALSVGLGFGLQEIFANFISGLIILFERPVRIGDVVTIGNLSGTVNRIRIRATTIVDFDRKEIIVPNKVFVTEQLVNWSLADAVTRIVINIGLSYDSNLDLARKLMLRTMQENSRIMNDPEPAVLFLGIGQSSYDHEMRYYVREISDRNPSIDEVLNQLVARFREHQIEIAFKQVDIFVRNGQGQQVHWSTQQKNLAADAESATS